MLLTSMAALAQPLTIGGHKAVQDTLYHMWLCSMPQDSFGTNLTAVVELDSTWVSATLGDSITVLSGDSVTFQDVEGGKQYPLTAITIGGDTVSGYITFTWLPVVELQGSISTTYSEGVVTVNMPDGSKGNDWRAKLKTSGNITNKPNKHKRNYSIKFLDEQGNKKNRRLLGLRKDNHWRLDAGQMDLLRVRNRICADLWLDITHDPWYIDRAPEAINGSRGGMTEVILNGEYRGIYNLCELVDRKQLQLVKYDTINNEFHGQLWFVKNWCRTATMTSPAECSNDSEMWDGIEVKYPDFDEVNPTDWSTLYNTVWFMRNVNSADDYQTYEDSLEYYYDLPIFIDYYVFIIATQALDNESKNQMYSCYDKAIDKRLVLTAWDLDMTLGAPISHTGDYSDKIRPDRPVNWLDGLPDAMVAYSTKFKKMATNRYWELRETCLNTDSLTARCKTIISNLEGCGAVAREEQRWTGDSDIGGKTLDLSNELDYVVNWIEQRMAFLDSEVFVRDETLEGDVDGDGEITVGDVLAIIDYMLGNPVESFNVEVADVNHDGEITLSDVMMLIDLILSN